MQLKKVEAKDFDIIYPLLEGFENSRITKDLWTNLFDIKFNNPENYAGLYLEDNGVVVGYWGLIFSKQIIDGREHKFCNMSSGIVKKEYRSSGLTLIMNVARLKGFTITNLTANKEVAAILTKLGFEVLDTHYKLLIPTFKLSQKKYRILINDQLPGAGLPDDILSIYNDHKHYNCCQFAIVGKNESCLAVVTIHKKKSLKFGRIHFLSHPETFFTALKNLGIRMTSKLGLTGFMIDQRFCRAGNYGISVTKKYGQPKFFKSADITDPSKINELYSELILLHN